jgi:hypothetical protein
MQPRQEKSVGEPRPKGQKQTERSVNEKRPRRFRLVRVEERIAPRHPLTFMKCNW